MVEMSAATWAVIIAAGLGCVITALHTLASTVRNEIYLHNLRIEVVTKRNAYIRDLSGVVEDDVIDRDSAMKIKQAHESAKKAEATIVELAAA